MKIGFIQAIRRVKKEWVHLKALENPRRSIVDYGTVVIIIDCVTENGPILGALWTFSTESKTKKGKSYDFQFAEAAVAETA